MTASKTHSARRFGCSDREEGLAFRRNSARTALRPA